MRDGVLGRRSSGAAIVPRMSRSTPDNSRSACFHWSVIERLAVPAVLASSRNEMPFPLIVRATIMTGLRLLRRCLDETRRGPAAMSWPSIVMRLPAKRGNAPAYASMSCPSIVSPRCPSRLTSMMPIRFASCSRRRAASLSHCDPSAISLSPSNTYVRYGRRSRRFAFRAMPRPIPRPWPSDPVAASTYGKRGVGWPSSRLPKRR